MKQGRIINDTIESLAQAWSGIDDHGKWAYDFRKVEEFIKLVFGQHNTAILSKAGFCRWAYREPFYYLQGFASQNDATSYDLGDTTKLLFEDQLPISAIAGDSYSARLVTSLEDVTAMRVVKEQELYIPLRFSGIKTSDGERMNAGISGTLHIERSTNNWSTYAEVGSRTLQSRDMDASIYDSIDIGSYLQEGEQQIRFYVSYEYTNSEGASRVAVSPYLTLGTIILTSMRLTFEANWHRPFNNGIISVGYFVQGYGSMLLYVECDGVRVVNGRPVTTSTETPVPVTIENSNIMTNGLHVIRAWLASAADNTVTGDVVESQVLYFDEGIATEQEKQTAYIMVTNVATELTPYVNADIMEYAVYKYGAETVPVVLMLKNANRSQTYLSHDFGNVTVGEKKTYRNAMQIPRGISTAYIYFQIDGTLQTNRYWPVEIDQTVDYTPTEMEREGFIFDASTRSNEEDHPEHVINALNGEIVEAEYSQTMKFNSPNGYVESSDDPKHLHIPAGDWMRISGYDPFDGLIADNTSSMTMEFDIKVSNVYDEKIPVLRVGQETASGVLGFEMLPLTGYHMTEQQHARGSQDFQMQEDERTHVTLNILNNLGGRGLNFVRIFINGTINREYTYGNDTFAPQGGSGGIVIGSTKADVDIYSIRVYKQPLSSHQVIQDYKSSIPSAEKKLEFHRKNDILGGNNTISYAKTKELYSTMLWIPDDTSKPYLPNYANTSKVKYSKGTLKVIFRYRYDGNGHHAGEINYDLSRIYTHMSVKGQGTSSMTYWLWNLRFQFSDASEVWSVNASLEKNTLLLTNVGKEEDEWECYGIFEEGGAHATKLDAKANWASSSQSHKMGMMNAYGALWKQIVGKQDPIYDADKRTRPCVLQEAFMFFVQDANGRPNEVGLGENESQIRFSNFMTFGPAKNDKATWGLKVKSPHYVVNGQQKSMYTCLEGSSNGRPLTEAKVPWLREEVFYYFNPADGDDPKNETFVYNDDAQFDFDKGPSNTENEGQDNEYDVPKGFTSVGNNMWKETEDTEFDPSNPYDTNGNTIKFYRRAWNFAYLNTHHLEAVEGDYNTLMAMANNEQLNQSMQYFVMNNGGGHQKGDCFRYNPLSEKNPELPKWVNAGTSKNISTEDGYAVLNLLTDLNGYMPNSYNVNDAISLKEAFITARLNRYRGDGSTTGSSLYWDEHDCDLCQSWGKVMAAKDNWCKNTYFKLRPDGLIGMNRDDDDTIMDKDNVGKTGTPYQVEEHDRYNDDGEWSDAEGRGEIWNEATGEYNVVSNPRNTYWNSQDSVLFTLREQTRGGLRQDMGNEMQLMVGTIFQTMVQLEGSVDNFFQKYFFDIQEYFPAVAYNEVARLLYEEAAIQMAAGNYTNNTDPMTQSLGDQLQGEKQWIKRRIPYMESYGQSSVFADSNGRGALSFRSSLATTDSGTTHGYAFVVTPHQFLYPAAGSESSSAFSNHRSRAGERVTLPTLTVTQNNNIFIFGIDYLRSVGDFAQHPTEPNSSIGVVGARLTEWIINEDGNAVVQNRSSSITFTTPRLQKLVMRNCTALNSLGAYSISRMSQLVDVDLRGCTGITTCQFPSTSTLKTIQLPSAISVLSLTGQPSLTSLSVESGSLLDSLTITGSPSLNVQQLLRNIYDERSAGGATDTELSLLNLNNVNWSDTKADVLMWLAGATTCNMHGKVIMLRAAQDRWLSFSEVILLIRKFGDIQTVPSGNTIPTDRLYIDYQKRDVNGVMIRGEKYLYTTGTHNDWSAAATNDVGNNIAVSNGREAVTFALVESAASEYATITDAVKGTVNVKKTYANNEYRTFTLRMTVTLLNGTVMTYDKKVGFHKRLPKIGDFAYADGAFDDEFDPSKELVGAIVKVDVLSETQRKFWVYAKENAVCKSSDSTYNTSSHVWGIYPEEAANNGFPATVYNEIRDDAGLANAVDTAMANITSSGIQSPTDASNKDYRYIRDTYLDANQDDGYAVLTGGSANDFDVENKNEIVINHAKSIINGYLGESYPTTPTELADAMQALVAAMTAQGVSAPARYRQLYYPAAFACHVYQPSVEGTLHTQYRRNKWLLPTEGLLCRIYNFFYNSCGRVTYENGGRCTVANANETPDSEALLPLFANILKRVADAGVSTTPFNIPTNSYYWSVTEYYSPFAWNLLFYTGLVYLYSKSYSLVVRPVAAFTYNI